MDLLYEDVRRIVISPHSDDLVFSLGGLALGMAARQKRLEDWIIFSRMNYISGDTEGNKDLSDARINRVSNLRLEEERAAALSLGNIDIKLFGKADALIRGHPKSTDTHRFPYGFNPAMDQDAFDELKELFGPLLDERAHIFVPLAIREHIDHLLVRNALTALLGWKRPQSKVFYYEDQPYASLADSNEWAAVNGFIGQNILVPLSYPIDLEAKLRLMRNYPSQVSDYHFRAVSERAGKIAQEAGLDSPGERVYLLQR